MGSLRTNLALAVGALACFLVCGAAGVAQAPSQTAAQQPTFRTGTALVEVDAIVRDRNGRFVPDLTAADFEVREDGVVQQVEQLYLVAGPGVKTAVALPSPSAQPAVPVASSVPSVQRTFVFLFDQEHIEPAAFDRAKKAALQFMTANFREGDIGGVVNGGRMINNRLTNVRAELQAAIAGLTPLDRGRSVRLAMREWPRLVDAYEIYLISEKADKYALGRALGRACDDDRQRCDDRGGPDAVGLEIAQKARQLFPDMRRSAESTLRQVGDLCDGLERLPGRKTVVFLSDGFLAEDSWGHFREVLGRAARASVRIYSLDTRGLNRGFASSDILEMGPRGGLTAGVDISTAWDVTADAPNSLAVDTGGLAIRNENDFAKALAEIANDTSSYYILGYRTTKPTFDGKFRQISVRVKREGTSVRARKGYVATEPPLMAAAPDRTPPPGASPLPPAAAAPTAAAPPTPPPAIPKAEAEATVVTTPEAKPPAGAVRLKPDVKERVEALGKIEPMTATSAAPPESLLAQARAGWDAYQKGDLKGARQALAAAAVHPAAPAWVRYSLGWTEFAAFDYAAAGAEWERVRSAAPEFEPVYFDLADSYLQQREYGKALEVLRAAEQRWPKDVEVYNAIGVVQVRRGALNDAVKTFEQAVSVNSNDATACYNLARTAELRFIQSQRLRSATRSYNASYGDRERAIEYYKRTIAIGKEFVEESRAGLARLGAVG